MKKKLVLLILLLFVFSSDVIASNLQECEYSEEYKKYLLLDDEEKTKIIKPNTCISADELNDKNNFFKPYENFSFKIGGTGSLPNHFDLRNVNGKNYVTSVKDQKLSGVCWSFATMASVESNILLKSDKTYDFSDLHTSYSMSEKYFENNEINNLGIPDEIVGSWGNTEISAAYMIRHSGPILESDFNFDDYYDSKNSTRNNHLKETALDSIKQKTVVDVNNVDYIYNENCNNESLSKIKQMVMNNGAVTVAYRPSSNYIDDIYHNYNGNEIGTTHLVSIIGWDDNIAAENFDTVPTKSGAFIIKNSWGTGTVDYDLDEIILNVSQSAVDQGIYSSIEEVPRNLAIDQLKKQGYLIDEDKGIAEMQVDNNDGYYYVSYEDKNICKYVTSFNQIDFEVEDNVYFYDTIGFNTGVGNINKSDWAANVFLTDKPEILKEITFYSLGSGTYNVYLSQSNINEEVNLSQKKLLGTVNSDYNGYHTLTLENDEVVDNNFAVIVEYKSTNDYPIGVQYNTNISNKQGRSFISEDGVTWQDIYDRNSYYIPSIKAYTDNIDYDFTIDVDNLVKDDTKDKFTVPINYNGIEDVDINNFEIKIFNSNNEDVTNKFNVSNNLINDKNIIIERNDDNLDNGVYNVKITYGYITNECSINLTYQVKGISLSDLIMEPNPLISGVGGNIKVRLNLNNVELEEIFNSVSVKIYNTDNEEKYAVNSLEFNDKKYLDVSIPISKDFEVGEYKLVASVGINNGLTGGIYSAENKFSIKSYIPVENISLNKEKIILKKGESEVIIVTITPDNALNKNINWSSSNQDVAKIDNTGKVTGVGRGDAMITATSEDGNKTASLKVVVQEPKAVTKSETISSNYNNVLYEGYGGKIVYNILLQDIDKDELTFKYFKDDVDITNTIKNVSFIENGDTYNLILNLDNQIKVGKYKIQISNKNIETIEKYFEVKEYIKVDSIDLNKDTIEIYQNESFDISSLITINPVNAINKNIKYELSNSNITLNNNIITGKVVGNCIIKIISVENENIYRELNVVIKEKYIDFKNNINVLEENNVTYLRGLNLNSNFNKLKSNISTNQDIKLYKKDNKTLVTDDALVGTGMILKIGSNNYEMVIRADINGDGKQTITDLSQLRQHLAEINGKIKTGAYLKAGDLNGDNKVSIIDLSKMRKELAG